jgi:SAM-dependent methyltransferase
MTKLQINPEAQFYVTREGVFEGRNNASGETLALSPDALVVLRELLTPRTYDDALAHLERRHALSPAAVAPTLDGLVARGLLVTPTSKGDSHYFDSYSALGQHAQMIADHARTDGFRRAIEAVVRPGMRVLDVGCGTGILSLFAARAGAAVVDAVDNAQILDVARAIARQNGYGDTVRFHAGDVERLALEGGYDVIVSEWLGYFAVTENMYPPVFGARDRWLKPGGVMVPGVVEMFLAPIEDPELYLRVGPGLWERPVYGFDFSLLGAATLRVPNAESVLVAQSSYLADPARLCRVDCATDAVEAFHKPMSVAWKVERAGALHGFVGHFTCDLGGGAALDTSSRALATHWRQHYFPASALPVERGDVLTATLTVLPMRAGWRIPTMLLRYEVTRAGKRIADERLRYNAPM